MKPEQTSENPARLEEQIEHLRKAIDVVDGRAVELRSRLMDVMEKIVDLESAIRERVDLIEGKLVGIEMEWEEAGPRLRDIAQRC